MILKSSLSLHRKNNIYKKSIFLLILLLFSISYLRSQDSLRIGTKNSYLNPINELKKDIESIINIQDFSNAFIGVCILSLETGEYIFNRNENICFVPASTNKIITTAAALDYLGSDFRYNTPFYLDGKITENGEFTGNIIIRGSGDPTFSKHFHNDCFEVFNEWTSKLDSLGIKSIRGNIIADDRYFDSNVYPPGWFYDDMLYSYSPQITALAFNDNKIDVTIKPGEKVGEQAKIITYPIGTNIFISNSITTLPLSEPSIVIPNRIERTDIIELKGGISLDSSVSKEQNISIAVEDPSIFFLNNFKNSIENRKIAFRGSLLKIDDFNDDIDYFDKQPVCEYNSPPLSEIIKVINKKSHNLAAELLFKTIAKETTGLGSFEKGTEQIKKFVAKNGISPDNVSIVDGSGLSRLNLISPMYQVNLLSSIYRSSYKNVFLSSLAVPGEEGTLKKRMLSSKAEYNVIAKTGTMTNVSTICGYIKTKDNEMLAFSIMLMNFHSPLSLTYNLQDLICMRLASFSRN